MRDFYFTRAFLLILACWGFAYFMFRSAGCSSAAPC